MTCQDDPVTVLRRQLHQLPCPTCGCRELVPILQCDYYPDGCLWLARCDSCRTRYHFDRRSVPIWAEDSKIVVSEGRHVPSEPLTEMKEGSHANP